MRDEASQAGRAAHFEELKVFLTGEKSPVSYAELAAKLGTNEAALRKEVQRLRHRYGELLREEIGRTVANPAEVEDELRHLFTRAECLSGRSLLGSDASVPYMKPVRLCDQCHGELPGDAPEGLCPKCLLKLGGIELGIVWKCRMEAEAECGEPGGKSKTQSPKSKVRKRSSGPKSGNEGNRVPGVPWPCGPRFGNYEVLEKIGQGGMGAVYKARQLNLDRVVALKLLPLGQFSRDDLVQRFRSEASAAAALQHPNIVAVHDVGEHDGQPFFSMDFVEGRTLAELVRDQPLPAKRAAAYLKTIAEAVHYAHQQGILHRDLKPSNVLIDASDQPRITDFGLAKRLGGDSDLTLTGQVLGSPNFMSPEQAEGRSDAIGPASDVYSLGALLVSPAHPAAALPGRHAHHPLEAGPRSRAASRRGR